MGRLAVLLRSRPRPSTLVLLAVFGGVLALYVIVRPATVTSGGTSPAPSGPAVPAASSTPSPQP